jgi:hypothetical protein
MPTNKIASTIKSAIKETVKKGQESLKATRREIKQWQFDHKVSFKSAKVKAEVASPRIMGESEERLMKRARQCVTMIARCPGRDQICAHQQMVCAELLTLAEEAALEAKNQGVKSSEPLIKQAFADAVADLHFDELQSIRLKVLEFNAIAGEVLQGSGNPTKQTIDTRKLLLNHMMNACNVRLFTKDYRLLKHQLAKTKAVTEEAAVEGLIDWLLKPSKELVAALKGNTRLDDILPLVKELAVGANVYGEGRLLRCLFDEFWGDDKLAIDLIEGLGRRAVALDNLTKGKKEHRDLNGTAWLMLKVHNAYYLSRHVHGSLKNGHIIWKQHESQSVPRPKPPTEADKAWAWSLVMGGDREVTNVVTSLIDGADVEGMIGPIERLADKLKSIEISKIRVQLIGLFGRFGYLRDVEDLLDFALTLKSIGEAEVPGGLMAHKIADLARMVANAHVSAHHEDLPPLGTKEQREKRWGQLCRDLVKKYAEAEKSEEGEPLERDRRVAPEAAPRTDRKPPSDKGKEREVEPSPDESASRRENVQPSAYPVPISELETDDWMDTSGPYREFEISQLPAATRVYSTIRRLFAAIEFLDVKRYTAALASLDEIGVEDGSEQGSGLVNRTLVEVLRGRSDESQLKLKENAGRIHEQAKETEDDEGIIENSQALKEWLEDPFEQPHAVAEKIEPVPATLPKPEQAVEPTIAAADRLSPRERPVEEAARRVFNAIRNRRLEDYLRSLDAYNRSVLALGWEKSAPIIQSVMESFSDEDRDTMMEHMVFLHAAAARAIAQFGEGGNQLENLRKTNDNMRRNIGPVESIAIGATSREVGIGSERFTISIGSSPKKTTGGSYLDPTGRFRSRGF